MATESINADEKRSIKAAIIKELVDAAEQRRQQWMRSGNAIIKNATFEDRSDPVLKGVKTDFGERIPKANEALQVFLPRLAIDRGEVKLTSRDTASPQRQEQIECTQTLLNVLTKINLRWKHHASTIKNFILRGRGVRITALSRNGVVYSPSIPSEDFIMDANSDDPSAAVFEGHYQILPRWELLEEVGDDENAMKMVKALPPWTGSSTDSDNSNAAPVRRQIAAKYGDDKRVDCVRVLRLYFRYGLYRYRHGLKASSIGVEIDGKQEVDDSPKLYVVDAKTCAVIQEREWEIPFHLDEFHPFPYTRFDMPGSPDELWPMSLIEAGRPYLIWMNRLLALMLGKTKTTMRLLVAMKRAAGDNAKDVIIGGKDIDILNIAGGTGGKTIKQFVEQFQWLNSDMQYAMMLLDRLDYYYSLATGQSSVLYTGDLGRQMRSAEEARVVREMSTARLDMMRACILDAESQVFKKEAFACRHLYRTEDLVPFIGAEKAERWGVLMPEGGIQMIAGYFASQMGVEPGKIVPLIEEQFAPKRPVSLSEWIYAADYKIEAGSTLRENFELARSLGDAMLNQPFAAMMRLADSNPIALPLAYSILPAVAELNQWPEEYRKILDDGLEFSKTFAKLLLQQQQQQAAAPPPGAEPPPGVAPQPQPMM